MRHGARLGTLARVLLWSAGSAAFFWLVVVRFGIRLLGRGPCPFALAWLVDHPIRRRYMARVLDRVGIQPGERVLELGPGPGAFTVGAARRAAPAGTLLAVDVQPRMIASVNGKVRAAGLANVETGVASAHRLPVKSASIDRAFLVAVLPEIPHAGRALAELKRVLKPGGFLSVTEEFLDPDYPRARTTRRWVERAGFRLLESHGNWFIYTLNFCRPAERDPSLELPAPPVRGAA